MSKQSKKTFESHLEELEGIVSQLNEGNVSLEDAIKLFEKGVKTSKECYKILNQSEKKIELLMKNDDGSLSLKDVTEEMSIT